MDSFDDLMNPSRAALEDNPFASPFGQRSSSPDPWATPFATNNSDSSAAHGFGDPTSNAFSDSTSPFASLEPSYGTSLDHSPFASSEQETSEERKAQDHSVTVPTPAAATPAAVDPLDSAAALAAAEDEDDDDDKPLANLRSPGFRESVAPPPLAPAPAPASSSAAEHIHAQPFSETATIRPVGGEDLEYRHPSSSSSLSSAAPSPSITQSSPPPPSSATASSFRSPLSDNHSSSYARQSMEHSFGNLSLGGDTLGGMGWQPEPHEQTPWQVDTAPVTPQRSAYTAADEEDSDDDKPIGQTMHRNESISNTARNDNGLQPVFTITVDDPQKVGDPIRSFTMYTVHTRTTSPLFQKSAFSVLRRYSDFLWLYETLSANNPGVVVPPVPEKNTFGRFDDQFVRQRRLGLEKCIQKIANHPVLGRDPDLRMFLESDSFALDIKHRKAEIAHEKGGLMASIGQTLTGPRFHETDEWFDRQKVYLDSLELQLRGLVKAIEAVAKQRQELSVATGEFATTVTDLSTSDVGKQLAHSLSGLAEVERTAQDLQNVQAEQDISTFNATVDEYARLINSVRLAFSSRIRMYHQWRNQESELLRTKQVHEKNRAQGKIPTDRLGYSLTQIAEAERRASEAKLDYENASKLVKSEVARFEQERIDDFKDSLHAFLEGMIARQKELIGAWEAYQHMLLKKVGAVPNTA